MVEFVGVDEAKRAPGLRVVMVGMVPSPWGEAAKGILHHEHVPYVATRLSSDRAAVEAWTGHGSAPIAVYEDEKPRTFMALLAPLPDELCPIPEAFRTAFTSMDDETRSALDPVLLAHRDEIYARHLELPLTL